jgi:hypothetical protein
MQIDLMSFIFGIIIAVSAIIIIEYIYGKIFGNKRLRELNREVRRLRAVVKKKDELIQKSLKEMQKLEVKDEERTE